MCVWGGGLFLFKDKNLNGGTKAGTTDTSCLDTKKKQGRHDSAKTKHFSRTCGVALRPTT